MKSGNSQPGKQSRRLVPEVILLALAMAACHSAGAPQSTPRSTSAALGCDPGDCDESGIIGQNGLGTPALVLNALTSSVTSLNALVLSPLTTDTFADPTTVLGRVLIDPDAREMMKYVARCALNPDQSLSWGSFTFPGYFGFCPGWQDNPPGTDEVCLQRVSACILSLNNYFHKQVMVFQTWEDPNLHGPFDPPSARTETIDRDTSTDVASFQPCIGPTFGDARNCGWTPDFAGKCTPGQRILLGAGATPNDLSCGGCATCPTLGTLITGQVVLRACAGLSGCDHLSPRRLAESSGISCEPGGAALAFDCPSFGPSRGYFSVMQGPYATDPGDGLGQVASQASVEFPVSVLRAYSKREGAYFGNIFSSSGLATGVNVYVDDQGQVQGKDVQIRGAIYQHMYACFDNMWRRAQLYFSGRICAQPSIDPIQSHNCASTLAGPCRADSSPPQAIPPQLPFRCTIDHSSDPIGYGDLEDCRHYDGTSWPYSATMFLNGGCDLTDNRDSCQRFDDEQIP